MGLLWCLVTGAVAAPLTELDFEILGLGLAVEPAVLTVPRDIPTRIEARLAAPEAADAPDVEEALRALRGQARVRALLRGPNLAPQTIEVRPGDPIPIPAFALAGDYVLEQIRLVRPDGRGGEQVLLDGTPSTVPIRVIDEVLVTEVTSRPLDLEEIRGRGIVIDDQSFDVREFQLALNVDGDPVRIRLPVALPSRELIAFEREPQVLVERLRAVNQDLADRQVVELPEGFRRPGLSFSVAAIPFLPVGLDDTETAPFGAAPITGLVVIPGNIAFLNQFFSVTLTVANVAPDGSLLTVRDLTAEISLPPGEDRVRGTVEAPGDDPLRLARIEGLGTVPVIDVVQPGPDDALGTADDIAHLPPQTQGRGEFLVEGLREGFHTLDITLAGVLHGLPSGPVEIEGRAVGAVLVRDPTFDITLAHPRTVRAGEPYDLYATITNTSSAPANLVTVHLESGGVSGAVLDPASPDAMVIDTLAPGDSFTQRFTLIAQKTGSVTAASFNAESGVTGRFRLTTGVDERGVPLAPNAIALPDTVSQLPEAVTSAALRVLGQALSVANAPAGALPAGVAGINQSTIVVRGRELGQAGLRIALGESPDGVLADLLLDWLGERLADDGFDELLRVTDAGADLMRALGSAFGASAAASGQDLLLETLMARALLGEGSLAAVAGGGTAPAPVRLTLAGSAGLRVGGAPGLEQTLTYADALPLAASAPGWDLAVKRAPGDGDYLVEVRGTGTGTFDLDIGVPDGEGQALLLGWVQLPIRAGGIARVRVAPGGSYELLLDNDGDGVTDATHPPLVRAIAEAAPRVVAVRQLEAYDLGRPGDIKDPATYGLLVGVLFDKPVAPDTAEDTDHYAVEGIGVLGARAQDGGRFVYLYLERPVGTLVARSITVSGVRDLRGNPMTPGTLPIETVLGDGARVFGQALEADGTPVPDAVLDLTVVISSDFAFTVSRIRTDASGAFAFDFVPRIGMYFELTVQHPQTRRYTRARASVRGAGQELLLYPTFPGTGRVVGTVTDAGGAPVPGAPVYLSSRERLGDLGANADALGRFVIEDVPVGPYGLKSMDGRGALGLAAGVLERAGDEATTDIQLILAEVALGSLNGRVFLADGGTPAAGFSVYLGSYDRTRDQISVVAATQSDADGAFALTDLPPGRHDLVALDPSGQLFGLTRGVDVLAGVPLSALVVMEATGAVEGVVYDAQGRPAAGALVAGGLALATAGGDGRFRIEGVPAGTRRIEAGDPVSRRRGSADVTVRPGTTVQAQIQLEARAGIQGRVLDANGNPVPRATVRLVLSDGFRFVFANDAGSYRFPDLPLGSYLLQAPGPGRDGLIAFMEHKGIPVCSAFTAVPPDAPNEYGCGQSTPPDQRPSFASEAEAIAAYQRAVTTLFEVSASRLMGPPQPDLGAGFGWRRVTLAQDSVTETLDIPYLRQGRVSGTTLSGSGLPLGAQVRMSALTVAPNGGPVFKESARTSTDAQSGAFGFGGIALFDLATFQNAGIRAGEYLLEAVSALEPGRPTARGQLDPNAPDVTGVELRFPPTLDSRGTISGSVLRPDGVTPAGAGVEVTVDFGDGIVVTTDADGRFVSAFPIAEGRYAVTAFDPVSGETGRAYAQVLPGEQTDIELGLLGRGDVRVRVLRPDGTPVSGAAVRLNRGGFPADALEGLSDGAGEVLLSGVSEGSFGVWAEEAGTGLTGRVSGIAQRGVATPVDLIIRGAGTVTGTFLAADGLTPVVNAAVDLAAGGIRAYGATDSAGRFQLDAVPVGRFSLTALDPLTGRKGRASGEVLLQGELVDVTLIPSPRGSVSGWVTEADGATLVPGARVNLSTGGPDAAYLQSTTRADGSFVFEAVPVGRFNLWAVDPVSGFTGQALGEITFEGESLTRSIGLAGYGSVSVQVEDSAGLPATNARVELGNLRSGVVAADGTLRFERVPLGSYRLVASSLSESNDQGYGSVSLEVHGQDAPVHLGLRGVGSLEVRVRDAQGQPAGGARVTLRASGLLAGEEQLPAGGATLIGFTDGAGRVLLEGIPLGTWQATAELGTVAAAGEGSIDPAGESDTLELTLGATGVLTGRVLLPDGATPAVDALVTARFAPRTNLQSGTLQVRADVNGQFRIPGIPLGRVTLDAAEPISAGIYRAGLELPSGAAELDLGDLVLDNQAPRVIAVSPEDGASAVPLHTAVELVFDEPMDAASFAAASFTLSSSSGSLNGTWTLVDGGTRLRFVPSQPLTSGTRYSVALAGAPAGPSDLVGLQVQTPYFSTFTAADVVPPGLVSISPADGAQGVVPQQVIRLAFSEPIAPGAALTLVDAADHPLGGAVARILGDSVLVLTPDALLTPNRTYGVRLEGVRDLAGNPLPGQPLRFDFQTLDTLAPQLSGLALDGASSRIAGTRITLSPGFSASDLARVEYLVGGVPWVSDTAPFDLTLDLPDMPGTLEVTATPVDRAGNRGAALLLDLEVLPDLAPAVMLTALDCSGEAGSGETCTFEVGASDDLGLEQILFSATGAAASSQAADAAGALQQTARFTLTVPADAPSGGVIRVQAAARDGAGGETQSLHLELRVRDARPPRVSIPSPVDNAVVIPGASVQVSVRASDDSGVASVTLNCVPALTGCGVRDTAGARDLSTTFTLEVPETVNAPAAIALTASATDLAGNTAVSAGKGLRAADTLPPSLDALVRTDGPNRVLQGRPVQVRASASDAVALAAIELRALGDGLDTGVVRVAVPGVTTGTGELAFTVPAGAAQGSTVEVTAQAVDAAGNRGAVLTLVLDVGDLVPPTARIDAPGAGAGVGTGGQLTLRASATDDVGVAGLRYQSRGVRADLSGSRAFPDLPSPVSADFTLDIPADTPEGVLTLAVVAVDGAGNASAEQTLEVRVTDTLAPAVTVVAPLDGASHDPRAPVTVTVSAQDNLALAGLGLTTSGATVFAEDRALDGGPQSASETFQVPFPVLPATGGSLILRAFATDAAGNRLESALVDLTIEDRVGPRVEQVTPADGASDRPLDTAVILRFNEPLDAATLAGAFLTAADGTPVSAGAALDGSGRLLTLTPAPGALVRGTQYRVAVTPALADPAGNAATAFTAGFTTVAPDAVPPRLVSTIPADRATEVGIGVRPRASFTEPLDPASLAGVSLRSGDVALVAGVRLLGDGSVLELLPAAPLPLATDLVLRLPEDLTDLSGNRLADAGGAPLAAPIDIGFRTGAFAITAPADGSAVVEGRELLIEARASASLAIATVEVLVNGVPVTVSGQPPYSARYGVTSADRDTGLEIIARARDAAGNLVAEDRVAVTVGAGIVLVPNVRGLAPGADAEMAVVLSSAQPEALLVELTPSEPGVAALPASVTVPAGALSAPVPLTGATLGSGERARNTVLRADSALGAAFATLSLGEPEPGQTRVAVAPPVSLVVSLPPSLGQVLLPLGATRDLVLALPSPPAETTTPIMTLDRPDRVTVAGPVPVAAGDVRVPVTLTGIAEGAATLTLRIGQAVYRLGISVGTPAPGQLAPVVAPPVGLVVREAPSLGGVVLPEGGTRSLLLYWGDTPPAVDTPVSVTSSSPAVADVAGPVILSAGTGSLVLQLTTGQAGSTQLRLSAGDQVRVLQVRVGDPQPDELAPVLAPPVMIALRERPSAGEIRLPSGDSRILTLPFLPAPALTDVEIAVRNPAPSLINVPAGLVIPAGASDLILPLSTGTGEGQARLILSGGGVTRSLGIRVGVPALDAVPPTLAPPVGVEVSP